MFAIFKPKAVVLLRLNVTNIVLYLESISCSDAEGLVVHVWLSSSFRSPRLYSNPMTKRQMLRETPPAIPTLSFFLFVADIMTWFVYTLHSFLFS